MELILKQLEQIILEMQGSGNYYAQPQRNQAASVVMPGKQEEWISRLSMVVEEVKVELKSCSTCAYLPCNHRNNKICFGCHDPQSNYKRQKGDKD